MKQLNLLKQGLALQAQSIGKKLEDYEKPKWDDPCPRCGMKFKHTTTCSGARLENRNDQVDGYGYFTFDPRKP